MSGGRIDLSDLDLFAHGDPFAAWRWLRAQEPVYWNETGDGRGFWALTRYDDIVSVYLDHASFSSAKGTVMGGSYRSQEDSASGRMLICADPPRHRRLRQRVHQGFTSRKLTLIREEVRSLVAAAVDRMLADGGCDFAMDVAPWLPAGMLAGMMGLSAAEARHVLALTRTVIGHRDPRYQRGRSESATLVTAHVDLLDFFMDAVERRRREPGDDVISLLLDPSAGEPLGESEVLYNCLNVAVGGDETTPFTASSGLLALIEHPDQTDRLYADPGLLPSAIDEILRWTSTNAYVQRTATRDVQIRGRTITRDQPVTVWNPSANRDETVFVDPDRFDVARDPNRHIAFGVGHHHCIGSTVAREEIGILFGELVRRRVRFELAGPATRLRSNFMLGLTSLPVEVISAG